MTLVRIVSIRRGRPSRGQKKATERRVAIAFVRAFNAMYPDKIRITAGLFTARERPDFLIEHLGQRVGLELVSTTDSSAQEWLSLQQAIEEAATAALQKLKVACWVQGNFLENQVTRSTKPEVWGQRIADAIASLADGDCLWGEADEGVNEGSTSQPGMRKTLADFHLQGVVARLERGQSPDSYPHVHIGTVATLSVDELMIQDRVSDHSGKLKGEPRPLWLLVHSGGKLSERALSPTEEACFKTSVFDRAFFLLYPSMLTELRLELG